MFFLLTHSFLSAAYRPLAAALSDHFVVWGLDLPGHGSAAGVPLPDTSQQLACSAQPSQASSSSTPDATSSSSNSREILSDGNSSSRGGPSSHTPITIPGIAQYVINAIEQAGLTGCYAFGHSAGGAAALLAASRCPHLFRALYCFEAVVCTPSTHAFLAAATANGEIQTDGQILGNMARKRRAVFESRAAAKRHLTAKPPFSRLHPEAVSLYFEHGFVEQAGGAAAQLQQRSLGLQEVARVQHVHTASTQQQQGQDRPDSQLMQSRAVHCGAKQPSEDVQQQQPVQLVCSPEQEAAYFDALHPPPAIDPNSIRCPVMLAVAAPAAASGATPAVALASHEGVKQWFYQHSSGPNRQLHGSLRVLNVELAAALPTAQLQEVQGVTHFGPLEQPQQLAHSCAEYFLRLPQQQQQQQLQRLQQLRAQPQPVISKL